MLTRGLAWTGAKLTVAAAVATLLLLLWLSLAPVAEQAEAGTREHLPPRVTTDHVSVTVDEGQTATNTGTYKDTRDRDRDRVAISASVGTVTKTGRDSGTWSWSLASTDVPADQIRTVTITARDSTGRVSKTTFSLTVRNLSPANDNWGQAQEIQDVPGPGIDKWATVAGNTEKATKETGEPSPSLSGVDCGISGTSNSVWFEVTPQRGGWLYLTTEGSSFDTVLGVYEGSSLSTLSQVDCSNENFGANSTDKMSAPVAANKTYYVQLSGTGGARSGPYTLKTRLHFGPGAWPSGGSLRRWPTTSPTGSPRWASACSSRPNAPSRPRPAPHCRRVVARADVLERRRPCAHRPAQSLDGPGPPRHRRTHPPAAAGPCRRQPLGRREARSCPQPAYPPRPQPPRA
jgi:hypothetical protein